jgi:predicted nucleotidyltransferase component of viral defense system
MYMNELLNFLAQDDKTRLDTFVQASAEEGLPSGAIEKDWWVTFALHLIYSLEVSQHLLFKGGTSLRKGWGLIERFSEDIDLVLDRSYLGFPLVDSNTKLKKLKNASAKFTYGVFAESLASKLDALNISDASISVVIPKHLFYDPINIDLRYRKLTTDAEYLEPKVLIEVGARSLLDPQEMKPIQSIVSTIFPLLPFADKPLEIPQVHPKRTFLEKVFLLHEEFQKDGNKIRSEKMSRHLYDLDQLMDTEFAQEALSDKEFFSDLVRHRKFFSKITGVDYDKHIHGCISIVPPDEIIDNWKIDYRGMQSDMIYGDSKPFEQLIVRMRELEDKFHSVE